MKGMLFWSAILLWSVLNACSQSPNSEFSFENYVNLTTMENLPIVAGSRVVLNCGVTFNSNSSPEVIWFGPDRNPITGGNSRISINREDITNDSFLLSQLTFFHIRTSEAGPYSCVANISVSDTIPVIVGGELNVTVKIQTPSSITVNPTRHGTLYEGTRFEILCSIFMNTDIVDTEIQPNLRKTPPHSTTNRFSFGDFVKVNESAYTITATFQVLSVGDRRGPRFIINISPASNDGFVHDSLYAIGRIIVLDVAPLPPPELTISTSSIVTAGESLSLTCTGYVTNHLAVNPTIEWSFANGSTIRSHGILGELQISTHREGVSNYTSTLVFHSLRTSHGGQYRCSVNINIPVISLSVAHEGETNVTVILPGPLVSVYTSSYSLYISGNGTNIVCTASLDDTTTAVVADEDRDSIFFSFTWHNSNGTELRNNSTTTTRNSSTLSLPSLTLLDIDIVCSVVTNITSNDFMKSSQPAIKSTNWTLKVLPPRLNITTSPISTHFFGGLRINLTCYIHLHSSIEHPLELSYIWIKPSTISTHTEEDIVQLEPLLYQTSLVIDELDRGGGDDGEYSCRINISSNDAQVEGVAVEVTTSIFVQAELFQFEVMDRLFNFNCAAWIKEGALLKSQEIIESIVTETRRRCTCDITAADITDVTFSCPPPDSHSTIFRANLHGNTRHSARELLHFLNEWVSDQNSAVEILLVDYSINNFCASITDGGTANCDSEIVPTTPNSSFIIVIVGGAVSVSIVLILAVCSGVIICVIVKTKLKQKHVTEMGRQADVQMATMNQQHSDNEYEEIGRYRSSSLYDEVGEKAYATLAPLKDRSEDNYTYSPYTTMAPTPSILNINDCGSHTDGEGDYESMKDMQ